jgi:dipeptidyl-peptidase-4
VALTTRLLRLAAGTLLAWPSPPAAAAQADPAIDYGQTTQPADSGTGLSLDRIFGSDEFRTEYLGPVRWIESAAAYARLEPDSSGGRSLVRYDAATGRRDVWVSANRLVPPGDTAPLPIEDYSLAPDGRRLLVFTNTRKVWRYHTRGDYWVLDLEGGSLRKLGADAAAEATLMFAKFSPDGGRVGYVREHDLYVQDLADGSITRLTRDGSATTINGTFDWVYEEELSLRDGWRWSPDGRHIAFWQLDASGVGHFHLINNTDSLYSRVIPVQYPKAGTTNSAARVGVVPASGGAAVWLAVPGDPRDNYIARMDWAASSREVLIQHLNRAQNTIRLMLGDAASGAVRTVLTERDDAWLDVVDDVVWLDQGREFTWVSERDGWRQVYRVSRDGTRVRPVTRGSFDVIQVKTVDQRGGWLYYIASPDDPGQRYLYRSRLDGKGRPERLTPTREPGSHDYLPSPDARWAVRTWSSLGNPPVTDVVRLPSHEVKRTLVDNHELRTALRRVELPRTSFFRVSAGPGLELDGWLMRPTAFDSTRRYPVLFYVYGEPAGQTVLDAWTGEEYLWHAMLTQLGYVVVSVDNRGTPAPRGRAFRKAAHLKIGVVSSADQAAAAEVIRGWPGMDSSRVGVWGWSGGGSTTLNLMFRYPGRFGVGLSVAPVPDQRLYDTIYQERFMGLPQENAAAYREGSPLTYAHRLRGRLLLVHGTGDDNVHYQGSERLINALVAAGRPFTLMAYPNRSHCICEGEGTQLHLYGLLTRYLTEHLPAGPR